jgi:hypothetical protein
MAFAFIGNRFELAEIGYYQEKPHPIEEIPAYGTYTDF